MPTEIVGIRQGIGPEALLYVSGLPGVSVEGIQAICDDQLDIESLWSEVYDRAKVKFKSAFLAGLSAKYKALYTDEVVECLIASNTDVLALALWYLSGYELMVEQANSSRINRFTTVDRKKSVDLASLFLDEFDRAMDNALRTINPNLSGCLPSGEVAEHKPIIGYRTNRL